MEYAGHKQFSRCSELSKKFKTPYFKAKQVGSFAFGSANWSQYFGEVGEDPPFSEGISGILNVLNAPCPFFSGKKVKDYRVLPKSKLREALGYLCSLRPHLKNYTKHPESRLDNNVAERAIRPLALGRKNWLFVGSEEGGEVAATLFSLVQSCKASGVNPEKYLTDVMKRLMSHNAQKLVELLPDQWAKAQESDSTS